MIETSILFVLITCQFVRCSFPKADRNEPFLMIKPCYDDLISIKERFIHAKVFF